MTQPNPQLQARAGSNVPSRSINGALVRAQVPRVLLDDALGDQLVAACPPGELLFTSGFPIGMVDFGMALGTNAPGLAGKIWLVNAQGEETSIAPVLAPFPGILTGVTYGGMTFGAIALSPGEKLIYRPTAPTIGKGFFAPELYYTDPGPGGVQQTVVDLADGAIKTLFAAPPGKSIQLVPFGDSSPASGGSSLTATTDVGTTLDLFLNDEGVDYKILAGYASVPVVLNPLGASLTGSVQIVLTSGQSLRAQRVGAAARLKVRSVFQLFNVEDAE